MPTTDQENPAKRTMRRFYEAKLAERLGQFGEMQLSRRMLRRAAIKQQDGTLGRDTGEPEAEEMKIRVGDEINHHHYPSTPSSEGPAAESPIQPQQPATPQAVGESTLGKWGKRAIVAGMSALGPLGLAAGYYAATRGDEKPPVIEQPSGGFMEYGVEVLPPEEE